MVYKYTIVHNVAVTRNELNVHLAIWIELKKQIRAGVPTAGCGLGSVPGLGISTCHGAAAPTPQKSMK